MTPDDTSIDQIEELAAAGHTVDQGVPLVPPLRTATSTATSGPCGPRRQRVSVVLVHCEDPAIMHCCGTMLAEAGHTEARWYPETRPVEAERIATERAVGYCATTGAATYVVHLSSAAALEALPDRPGQGAAGLRRDPAHLPPPGAQPVRRAGRGSKYAGAPAAADRRRPRRPVGRASNDGTVSTVCTDHAPWTLEQKLDPSLDAVNQRQGMAELETILPVLWSEGVASGKLSVSRFVDVTSTSAARLFGLYPRKGTIAPGSDADLVVWDPNERRTVDGTTMHSRAGYSPYDGWEVTGWPAMTISRGEVVARGTDVIGAPGRGRLAPRSRFRRP